MTRYQTNDNNLRVNTPITAVAASTYTALLTDYIIDVNFAGAVTITLPAPSTTGATVNVGKIWVIKDVSGAAGNNNITISPASGLIDGQASLKIAANYGYYQVMTNGTNYFSVASQSGPVSSPTLNVQTFTSSGTYTPTANIQYAIVELVGGGGGGGGAPGTLNSQGGAGGGSGGYAKFAVSAAQIGASQAITIGSGGGGTTTTGSAGTASSFGALATANGGSGGANAGSNSSVATATGGAGGSVTVTTGSPIFTMTGQKGGNFAASSAATLGFINLGAGGSNPLGFGAGAKAVANSTPNSQITADSSVGFGAGGGGSGTVSQTGAGSGSATGGSGLAGYCSVTEYVFTPAVAQTGSAIIWSSVAGTTQTMVAANGYYTTNAAATTLTLPTTAVVGTMMAVIGTGAGLWTIAQNPGQNIQFGQQVTTTGVGGSLVATAQGNAVWLLCTTANNNWFVTDSVGEITVN